MDDCYVEADGSSASAPPSLSSRGRQPLSHHTPNMMCSPRSAKPSHDTSASHRIAETTTRTEDSKPSASIAPSASRPRMEVTVDQLHPDEIFHCNYLYYPGDDGSGAERPPDPPEQGGTPFSPRSLPLSPFVNQLNGYLSPRGSSDSARRRTGDHSSATTHSSRSHRSDNKGESEKKESLLVSVREAKSQLATLNTSISSVSEAIHRKKDTQSILKHQLTQTQQQVESYQERLNSVKLSTRVKYDEYRTSEELSLLRDMVSERVARCQTMQERKAKLEELWDQLHVLIQQTQDEEEGEQGEGDEDDEGGNKRAMSVRTYDALYSFLNDILQDVDAMANICIQQPSPPTASYCSRINKAHRVRNVNEGNNGYFSFFGGATVEHLSAKPLSTFLSCASRLGRLCWRLEEELQLHARELGNDSEEEELKQAIVDAGGCVSSRSVMLDFESPTKDDACTPVRRPDSAKALFTSPELSGNRRGSISSPSKGGGLVSSAPQLMPLSLTYAYPRISAVSHQLDMHLIRLQKEYEQEIETQRKARRRLASQLTDAYKTQTEPQLLAQRKAARAEQETLARQLVEAGVGEVSLSWVEHEEREEVEGGPSSSRGRGRAMVGKSIAAHRAVEGEQSAVVKYMRQVTVHAWQAAATSAAVPRALSVDRTGGEDGSIMSSTRCLLGSGGAMRSPAPAPRSARRNKHAAAAPTSGRGSARSASSHPGRLGASHAATSLQTVSPMSPSPLKGCQPSAMPTPASARSSTKAGGGHSGRGARGSDCSRYSARTTDSEGEACSGALVEETRERIGGGKSSGGSSSQVVVDLMGVHPVQSQEVLDSGAVKISLVFFGEEGRRRAQTQKERDDYVDEFWELRAQLACVDEDNFLLQAKLEELESTYSAAHERQETNISQAHDKVKHAKAYYEALMQEKQEWEEIRQSLEQLVSPPADTKLE